MFRKSFFYIFFSALIISSICVIALYQLVRESTVNIFLRDYQNRSNLISRTISELEKYSELISLNAAYAIRESISHHGLPSKKTLQAFTRQFGISDIFIINSRGKFINEAFFENPNEYPESLFDFSPFYKGFFSGNLQKIHTPMLRCMLKNGEPYINKYTMLLSYDEKYIIEISISLDSISKAFTDTLRSDSNIKKISLYSKLGNLIGTIQNTKDKEADQKITIYSDKIQNPIFKNNQVQLVTKVEASTKFCYECGDENGSDYVYYLLVNIENTDLVAILKTLKHKFLLIMLGSVGLSLALARFLALTLTSRLTILEKDIDTIMKSENLDYRFRIAGSDEVTKLSLRFNNMLDIIQISQRGLVKATEHAAFRKFASDTFHNMNGSIHHLKSIFKQAVFQDETNVITATKQFIQLDRSLTRISKARKDPNILFGDNAKSLPIVALVETVVHDFLLEPQRAFDINFSKNFLSHYSTFIFVDEYEFKIILSNLIENAIHAQASLIQFQIVEYNSNINVVISDNGSGVSDSLKHRVGERGFTHGKSNGSGIGFSHAKEYLNKCDGNIIFNSTEGIGSTVTITLPLANVPPWFVHNIDIPNDSNIAIVRNNYKLNKLNIDIIKEKLILTLNRYSISDIFSKSGLLKWLRTIPHGPCAIFFFGKIFDQINLDIIKKIRSKNREIVIILVSDYFEISEIQNKCINFNIGLIPSSFVSVVPMHGIQSISEDNIYDAIVIDDDKIELEIWRIDAIKKGKKFLGFNSISSFINSVSNISKKSPIHIDFNLNGARGDLEAKILYDEYGFKNITIQSGSIGEISIEGMYWITGGLSYKGPNWNRKNS